MPTAAGRTIWATKWAIPLARSSCWIGGRSELDLCYAGKPSHPVFVALEPTIREFDIPAQPFRDLLTAFRQDQTVHRHATWDGVLAYCRYSANPVGRLVLYLCGYRDAERQRLSDATCTALQLANFWQDVSRDLDKGRIYIPADALERHGLQTSDIEAHRFDKRYVELMRDLIARTRELFAEGRPLASMLASRLSIDIELFSRGAWPFWMQSSRAVTTPWLRGPRLAGRNGCFYLGARWQAGWFPESGRGKT